MTELNVSCIQRFSTGDGPGIRTTVFLKGCNLRCPWCHNPENLSSEPVTLEYKSGIKTTYGKMMSIDLILSDVLEDIDFYKASSGGVTLSGGEPLLQSKQIAELAKALQSKGVSVLIDTAGCVPWSNFADVIEFTDTFYFDYKTSDPEKYEKVIGADKELVLNNLTRLVKTGKNVHARIPLIPGFNTDETDQANIGMDLFRAGVRYVDLLPFHRLGSAKYTAMGKEYAYKNTLPLEKDITEKIKEIHNEYFIVNIE
ncbi:MAG: radical SAM protein [Clostridia bacterium]|nr:radical SAM protein [Clostridia bacterium]